MRQLKQLRQPPRHQCCWSHAVLLPATTPVAAAHRRTQRWQHPACQSLHQDAPDASVDASTVAGGQPSADSLRRMVEEVRAEEEAYRARREQMELQLMRMAQQDMLAARKLQMARNRPPPAHPPGTAPAPSSASNSAPPAGGSAGSAGPPAARRRTLKKSKRMTAMAAAAGLLRVNPSGGQPSSTSSADEDEAPSASGRSNGLPAGGSGSPSPTGDAHTGGALGWGGALGPDLAQPTAPALPLGAGAYLQQQQQPGAEGGQQQGGDADGGGMCVMPKPIFIISDCTGESAARTVRAALNQFEFCFKQAAPATIIVFRFVEDEKKAYSIVETAAKEDALVVYTLVNPASLKAVQTACKLMNVRNVDLWSNLLDHMERHLDAERSGVPMSHSSRRPVLTEDYFKLIEAVEYTRKMDDGARPEEWKTADLLILGVSRCGKTPLSIFLGQRGYKVANLPLVPGVPIPKELYQIDQTRIVGLTIDPNVLMSIRRNRVGQMGVRDFGMPIDYAEIQKIHSELAFAQQLYAANEWPVLDVTLRGVEETAARILKLLNDKRGDASPQWVEEMYGRMAARSAASNGNGNGNGAGAQAEGRPVRSLVSEQIYGGFAGEQFLVEGLY